jgi:hypothetical protein
MLLELARANRERARRALEVAATLKSESAAESLTRYAAELQRRARQLENEAVGTGHVPAAWGPPDVIVNRENDRSYAGSAGERSVKSPGSAF